MAPSNPKTDARLLGVWKSDRQATVAERRFPKPLAEEKRKWFLGIFGRLQIAYTRSRIRGQFRGHQFVQRYELLARDHDSVAIRYLDSNLTGRWLIQHIHFEGKDRYWIALGANREWFKRIKTKAVTSRDGVRARRSSKSSAAP